MAKDTPIDMAAYRADFPILSQQVNGKNIAYLDSASSAQKPQAVIDIMRDLYQSHYANIHRGLYNFSQTTTESYEAVRTKVTRFINAKSENEIVFTRNTTEAINLVAESWGREFLSEGDEIILTEMEHHANIVPWQLLEQKIGVVIKTIPVLDNGTLDFDSLEKLLSDKTKLLSMSYISNALGTVNDVHQFTRAVKAYNADIKMLIDGTQAAVHQPVDVQAIGCDFFVFTGHKLYGPNGIGVLWAREELLNTMPPYQGGGDMIETVSFTSGTTFKEGPARFEAGTPAIAEVIALGAAIDYVTAIGMDSIEVYEAELLSYMQGKLNDIEGLNFYGTGDNKVGIASFTADWAHTSDIAMILDQCGVAVRTGHHCCMPLMERFGIDGTVRASLGLYNNETDIDALENGLMKAKEMLS